MSRHLWKSRAFCIEFSPTLYHIPLSLLLSSLSCSSLSFSSPLFSFLLFSLTLFHTSCLQITAPMCMSCPTACHALSPPLSSCPSAMTSLWNTSLPLMLQPSLNTPTGSSTFWLVDAVDVNLLTLFGSISGNVLVLYISYHILWSRNLDVYINFTNDFLIAHKHFKLWNLIVLRTNSTFDQQNESVNVVLYDCNFPWKKISCQITVFFTFVKYIMNFTNMTKMLEENIEKCDFKGFYGGKLNHTKCMVGILKCIVINFFSLPSQGKCLLISILQLSQPKAYLSCLSSHLISTLHSTFLSLTPLLPPH